MVMFVSLLVDEKSRLRLFPDRKIPEASSDIHDAACQPGLGDPGVCLARLEMADPTMEQSWMVVDHLTKELSPVPIWAIGRFEMMWEMATMASDIIPEPDVEKCNLLQSENRARDSE